MAVKEERNVRTINFPDSKLELLDGGRGERVSNASKRPGLLHHRPVDHKIADSNQPSGAIQKQRPRDRGAGDKRLVSSHRGHAVEDVVGVVTRPRLFNLEGIEKKVEVGELADRFTNHVRSDLLVDRCRIVVVLETKAFSR